MRRTNQHKKRSGAGEVATPTADLESLKIAILKAGRENATHSMLFHSAIAERLGLGGTDHKALEIIARTGPMPAGKLADALHITGASATALIDRLEARGFVVRMPDPGDRRRTLVTSTRVAHDQVAPMFVHLQELMRGIMSDMDEAELQVILRYIQRCIGVLNEAIQGLPPLR